MSSPSAEDASGPGLEVPTIDISGFEGEDAAASARVVSDVRRACESVGFFQLVNHGVPEDTLRLAMSAARAFFERPLEEKMAVADLRKGYIPVGGCDNAVRPTSMHEKFSCARVDGVDHSDPYYGGDHPQARLYFGDDNRWPTAPAHFRDAYVAYYKAMEALVARLLRVFAVALGSPADFFQTRVDKHVTNLVALWYPPVARGDGDEREGQDARARGGGEVERVKPHTDPTDVTVLAFERGPEGLQVWPEGRDGWIDVPSTTTAANERSTALLVNLGDVLRFWTNDRWQSTRHRVVVPERREGTSGSGEDDGGDRLSLVFFHMPNYDCVVDCEDFGAYVAGPDRPRKYPPFKSGERSHFAQLVRGEEGLPDRQTLRPDGSRGD